MNRIFFKAVIAFIVLVMLLPQMNGRLYGQKKGQDRLDSLLVELPKMRDDSNKVKVFEGITFEFLRIDPYKGIAYAEQGIKLSEKLQWEKGVALLNTNMGAMHSANGDYEAAIVCYYTALRILEKYGLKSKTAECFAYLGFHYRFQSEYQKATYYFDTALNIFEATGNKWWIALVLREKAEVR